MRLLYGKLTFCRHSIVPYILANWLPVLPSTSWCAKVSLHGTILGQMSHPQAEDLFCQAHVTFPNTGRQPPILVDSKSVLIVFIVNGALFLFQLLFDLQCSSMGGTKRVLFACVSVCVCVCACLYLSGVSVCVEVSFIGPHAHGCIREKSLGQQLLMLLSCLAFSQLWKHISTQECGKSFKESLSRHRKDSYLHPQLRYRFRTKCSSLCFVVTKNTQCGCGVMLDGTWYKQPFRETNSTASTRYSKSVL